MAPSITNNKKQKKPTAQSGGKKAKVDETSVTNQPEDIEQQQHQSTTQAHDTLKRLQAHIDKQIPVFLARVKAFHAKQPTRHILVLAGFCEFSALTSADQKPAWFSAQLNFGATGLIMASEYSALVAHISMGNHLAPNSIDIARAAVNNISKICRAEQFVPTTIVLLVGYDQKEYAAKDQLSEVEKAFKDKWSAKIKVRIDYQLGRPFEWDQLVVYPQGGNFDHGRFILDGSGASTEKGVRISLRDKELALPSQSGEFHLDSEMKMKQGKYPFPSSQEAQTSQTLSTLTISEEGHGKGASGNTAQGENKK